MPRSRHRAASPLRSDEVSIMIVAPLSCGSLLICSATAKPSWSGMKASSRIRANGCPAAAARFIAVTADTPLPTAVGRICHWATVISSIARLVALSSTIRTGRPASALTFACRLPA